MPLDISPAFLFPYCRAFKHIVSYTSQKYQAATYGGVYFVSAIGIIIEWTPWKGFIFPTGVIPRKQMPLLGTLIRDGQLFSRSCFPRKQKPLLGTLIRDGQLCSRSCSPRKQEPLLGTLIRDEQRLPGRVFSRKQKPLLGTPTPNTTAFFRSCFS